MHLSTAEWVVGFGKQKPAVTLLLLLVSHICDDRRRGPCGLLTSKPPLVAAGRGTSCCRLPSPAAYPPAFESEAIPTEHTCHHPALSSTWYRTWHTTTTWHT